jgi:hypothetical protein
MHNWNVLYLPTCDGSSFLSQRDSPLPVNNDEREDASSSSSSSSSSLHMRGRAILSSTIMHALSDMAMTSAETIVHTHTYLLLLLDSFK